MKEKISVKKPKDGKALFFEVPSKTVPDKKYTIRVMPDGDVRCSCIANTTGNVCLHIRYFKDFYNEEREKMVQDIRSEDLIEYKKSLEPEKKEDVLGPLFEESKEPEKPVVGPKKPSSFAGDFPF
jgi:hypothetical protein